MRITSSTLLNSDKTIEFYNSALIVKDGPNMTGKLDLSDIIIPHDSFFTSKMTLESKVQDFPIMYGFLGTEITFIFIKVTYGGELFNPQSCPDKSAYIEYYFEDQPLVRRYFTSAMMLTGDAEHRIPQIYLYNPTDYQATIEIMAGNIDINALPSSVVTSISSTDFVGLAFNDILTDQMYGLNCTGSTQYEVMDIDGNIQIVIPYNRIDIVKINSNVITVVTEADGTINLSFVSEFHAKQALSRMNWVRENSSSRYLTKTNLGYDTTSPTMTFKPLGNPTVISGLTTVTSSDIIYRYIDSVIDFDDDGIMRDGIINNNDVNVSIMNTVSGDIVSAVTSDGNYSVTFSISDIAGNTSSSTKPLLVDGQPPLITLYNVQDIMSLTGNTQTPGTIETDDIILYYIDNIWDTVDGIIPRGNANITISSGLTYYTEITSTGIYDIDISVSDTASNTTSIQKILQVI